MAAHPNMVLITGIFISLAVIGLRDILDPCLKDK